MSYSKEVNAILNELEMESQSSRKCLVNIPEDKFSFKPHPTSMEMKYLAQLVAEIPLWIKLMIEDAEINFETYKHPEITTNADLLKVFDESLAGAKKALQNATEEQLQRTFRLRNGDKELYAEKTLDYISPTINHWVHHRGQLTVYMRICEIPVPSIYGPSGNDKNY